MYDRILLPTDGSPGFERVTDHALDLAATTGASLHALYVVEEDPTPLAYPESMDLEVADALTDAGEAALDRVAERARERDVPVETGVRHGVPHRAIVAYADEVDADVVVMGTHGRSGLDRYLLGSVTERVLRTADRPVLALRLSPEGGSVDDASQAEGVARETLDAEGTAFGELREEPYREASTWVVPVLTGDGRRVNVHVDAATGEARVAHVDE